MIKESVNLQLFNDLISTAVHLVEGKILT